MHFESFKGWNPHFSEYLREEKITLYSYPGYQYTHKGIPFKVANSGYSGRSWFIKIDGIDDDNQQYYTKKAAIEACIRLIDKYLNTFN